MYTVVLKEITDDGDHRLSRLEQILDHCFSNMDVSQEVSSYIILVTTVHSIRRLSPVI